MAGEDERWLTVPEVARRLLVSMATVQRWIETGRLPARPTGRRGGFRVREDDVLALMDRVRRHPESDEVIDPETARSPGTRNAPLDPETRVQHERGP
ncbi:MAG TPA: helix-turn-helix domain-containing protein [Dehalococcoidia bacterium]